MNSRTGAEAYLNRIGVTGACPPDLATLRAVVKGHAKSIAFENLDPFTGREVSLDLGALTAKLVSGGRGGYCFEQNLLLADALRTLGYSVTGLTGRVIYGRPHQAVPGARTHMLLLVETQEGAQIVDVGFGGMTLTGVLGLIPGLEQGTPHEPFRIQKGDPHGNLHQQTGLLMQALVNGEWRSLYWFDLVPAELADLEMANWYLCHHASSRFVKNLMLARPDDQLRYALNNTHFSVHHLNGRSERRELRSPSELRTVLEKYFLLNLADVPELDGALARISRQ